MISPSASLLLSLYPGNDMASAFRATVVIGAHLRRAETRVMGATNASINNGALAKCVQQ